MGPERTRNIRAAKGYQIYCLFKMLYRATGDSYELFRHEQGRNTLSIDL